MPWPPPPTSTVANPSAWPASSWPPISPPADASVQGRLIARQVGRGKHKQWLYLFTTLVLPAEEIVACYGKRWRIETDLRSLKQTVRLQHLAVQSTDLMEKELLVAVLAYNLVRTIMYLAAQRSRSGRISKNPGGPRGQTAGARAGGPHRLGRSMQTPPPHQTSILSQGRLGPRLPLPPQKGGEN